MKGWERNVISYNERSDPGLCPRCGSNNIEVAEFTNGSRRSLTFSCKRCGSYDHFDGFKPVMQDKEGTDN